MLHKKQKNAWTSVSRSIKRSNFHDEIMNSSLALKGSRVFRALLKKFELLENFMMNLNVLIKKTCVYDIDAWNNINNSVLTNICF